jgi:hypothetical protein
VALVVENEFQTLAVGDRIACDRLVRDDGRGADREGYRNEFLKLIRLAVTAEIIAQSVSLFFTPIESPIHGKRSIRNNQSSNYFYALFRHLPVHHLSVISSCNWVYAHSRASRGGGRESYSRSVTYFGRSS